MSTLVIMTTIKIEKTYAIMLASLGLSYLIWQILSNKNEPLKGFQINITHATNSGFNAGIFGLDARLKKFMDNMSNDSSIIITSKRIKASNCICSWN